VRFTEGSIVGGSRLNTHARRCSPTTYKKRNLATSSEKSTFIVRYMYLAIMILEPSKANVGSAHVLLHFFKLSSFDLAYLVSSKRLCWWNPDLRSANIYGHGTVSFWHIPQTAKIVRFTSIKCLSYYRLINNFIVYPLVSEIFVSYLSCENKANIDALWMCDPLGRRVVAPRVAVHYERANRLRREELKELERVAHLWTPNVVSRKTSMSQ